MSEPLFPDAAVRGCMLITACPFLTMVGTFCLAEAIVSERVDRGPYIACVLLVVIAFVVLEICSRLIAIDRRHAESHVPASEVKSPHDGDSPA